MTKLKSKALSPPPNVEHPDSNYLGSKTNALRLRRRPLNLKNKNTRTSSRLNIVENQLVNENGISRSETNSEIILISCAIGENESEQVALSEPGKLSEKIEEDKVCDREQVETRKEICENVPGICELPVATAAKLGSDTAEPCPTLALSETPVGCAYSNVSSTVCPELLAVDEHEPTGAWEQERDDLSQVTWDCSVQQAQSKRGQYSIDEVKKIASSFNNPHVEQDQPLSNFRRLSLLHNSLVAQTKRKRCEVQTRRIRRCQPSCEGRDLVREMVKLLSCRHLESQTESCKELRSSSETLAELSTVSAKNHLVKNEGSSVGDDIWSDDDVFQNVTFLPETHDRLTSVKCNAKIMSRNPSAVTDYNLQSVSNVVSHNFSSSQIRQVSSSGTPRNSEPSLKSCMKGLLSTSLCDAVQSSFQHCFDDTNSLNADICDETSNGDSNHNQANFRIPNLTDESDLGAFAKPSSPAPLQPAEVISSYNWHDRDFTFVSPTFSNSLIHLDNSDECFNEVVPGDIFEDTFSDAANSDWACEEFDVSPLQCDIMCQSSTVPIVNKHKSVKLAEDKSPFRPEKPAEAMFSTQRDTDIGLEIPTFSTSVLNRSKADECFSEDVPEEIFGESFSEDASTDWSSQCSDEALLQCDTVCWSSTSPLKDDNPSLFSAEHNVKLPFQTQQIVHETSHCLDDDVSADFLSPDFSSPTFNFADSDGYFSEDVLEELLEADTLTADQNSFSEDPNTFSANPSTNWSSQTSDLFLIQSDRKEPSRTSNSDMAMHSSISDKLKGGQLACGNWNSSDPRFYQNTSLGESGRVTSAAVAVMNAAESHTGCQQKELLSASPLLSSPVFLKTGSARHVIKKSDRSYTFKKVSYALLNSPGTQWRVNVHSSGAASISNSPVEVTGQKLSEVSLENNNLNFFMNDDDDELFAAEVVPLLGNGEDNLSTTKSPACSQPRCSPEEIEMKRQAALRKRARSQSRN